MGGITLNFSKRKYPLDLSPVLERFEVKKNTINKKFEKKTFILEFERRYGTKMAQMPIQCSRKIQF